MHFIHSYIHTFIRSFIRSITYTYTYTQVITIIVFLISFGLQGVGTFSCQSITRKMIVSGSGGWRTRMSSETEDTSCPRHQLCQTENVINYLKPEKMVFLCLVMLCFVLPVFFFLLFE